MVPHKRFDERPRPEAEASAAGEEAFQSVASSWEAEVLRRIAPRLAEVQRRVRHDDEVLGWEAAGFRRLAQVTGAHD